jgi:hypothetical protein
MHALDQIKAFCRRSLVQYTYCVRVRDERRATSHVLNSPVGANSRARQFIMHLCDPQYGCDACSRAGTTTRRRLNRNYALRVHLPRLQQPPSLLKFNLGDNHFYFMSKYP